MKTWITAACVAALCASSAQAGADSETKAKNLKAFCNFSGNIAHDAVLGSLKGEKRPDLKKKLDAQYFQPFAEDKNLAGIMRSQIDNSLKKAYDMRGKLKLKPSEYEGFAYEIGKAEAEVCMEVLSK